MSTISDGFFEIGSDEYSLKHDVFIKLETITKFSCLSVSANLYIIIERRRKDISPKVITGK